MSSSFLNVEDDLSNDPYSFLFDEDKAKKAAAAVKIFQDVSVGSTKEKMKEQGMNGFVAWIFSRQIPRLERWKKV